MSAPPTATTTTPETQSKKRPGWHTGVAGMAGNMSILIFQPLENVKLRLQANDGMKNHHLPKYNGFMDTFKKMWKNEGYIAFYRGMFVNILANALSGGMFFYLFGEGKKRYNYDRETSPLWLTIWLGFRAGFVTMFIVTPVWCVKTRVTLHWNEKDQNVRGYKLCQDTVKSMYRNEGPSAFFRGIQAQLGLSFYAVIQMTVYEKLSKLCGIPEKPQGQLVTPDKATFFVGGTARSIASFVFYPLNVMKTRLQKQRFSSEEAEKFKKSHKIQSEGTVEKEIYYTNLRKTAYNIFTNEGIRGFYKG